MKFVTTRTRPIIVAAVLIFAISIILPVSAKKTTSYKALGTIDSYADAWSAVIVGGDWSVTVNNEGELQFTAMYHELNLNETEENSPVGSVDIFTFIVTTDNPDEYEIKGKTLTFSGTMQTWKVWTMIDWTTTVLSGPRDVTITITPTTFYMDTDPAGGQDWDRYGTTTQFK
jgi:hypothetical protein